MQVTVDAPEKVHSLSLLEPALVSYVPSGAQFGRRLQSSLQLYVKGLKAEALDSFLEAVFQGTPQYRSIIDRELPDGAYDMALGDLDTIFKLEAPSLQSSEFTAEDAKRINQPVPCVTGEYSPVYFKEIQTLLLSWFPNAETLTLPKTSHLLHMMDPKAVAEGLKIFFSCHSMLKK